MSRSLRFLLALALAASSYACEGPEHVVLIDVYTQAEFSVLDMTVVSREGLGAAFTSQRTYPEPRTPAELELTPIRLAVELPAPSTVIVHLTARSADPDGDGPLLPDVMIATRCYGVNGVITDQLVLVGPIGALDADMDTYITDPDVACREPAAGGGDRACTEMDLHVCDSMADVDCDDMDGMIFPGATAGLQCQDGIDQDCDGDVDEACGDGDGDGVNACPPGVTAGCDCDDFDSTINPRAEDICQDGIDQDCDMMDACCDADGDGFAQCRTAGMVTGDCVDIMEDCPAGSGSDCVPAEINPSAAEVCDSIDNNCNNQIDELDECRGPDLDGDGILTCGREDPGDPCEDGIYDCDPAIYPGARERCGNMIDEDLDGMVDEATACPAGDMDNDGQVAPRDCDDMDPLAYTHAAGEDVIDRCGDGVAQSCVPGEDQACSNDRDGDGYVEPARCEDNAMINPDQMEVCNGIDDNCDGTTDEVLDISRATGCTDAMVITFASDFGHCGACRNLCDSVISDQCMDGICDCAGEPGAPASCTGTDPACCMDGCKDLDDDRENCGGCGLVCGEGETCAGGICQCGATSGASVGAQACPEPAGVAGAEAIVCCGTTCRDVRDDVLNCGGCNTVCGTTSVICDDRICRCDPASPNLEDCNGDLGMGGDGCATNTQTTRAHCGRCGNNCNPANASGVCRTGSCQIMSCNTDWDDCDGLAGNGCEGNLRSLTHCNSCGSGCSISNATATCATRSCRVASCNSLWDDCNSDGTSCETRLTQDSNCGGCGVSCDSDESCNGSGRCACGGTTGSVGGGPVCGGGTPNCNGSACVRCYQDSHCGGGTPQCVSNNCRLCDPSDHSGCSGGTPRCLSGTSCVECLNDGDCGGSNQCVGNGCQVCDPSDDGGCSGGTPQCLGGTSCVECINDSHCPGSNVCVSNSCQVCNVPDDRGCSGGTPQCLSGTSCVECTSDSECPGSNVCVSNSCQVCNEPDDRGCSGGTPECLGGTMCVECIDSGDCSGSSVCVSNACQVCNPTTDAGCSGSTPQCLGGTMCVECIGDGDCAGSNVCVSNSCEVCDASDDRGCSGMTPQCLGGTMCVECINDGHCAGSTVCVSNACQTCDPSDDRGCSGMTPICHSSEIMCVQCESDADCGGMMCHPSMYTCP